MAGAAAFEGAILRGSQLTRQWRILKRIEVSRHGLTAAQIADIGGTSLRTAYRDLDDLQAAGFPIYSDPRENGSRWKLIETFASRLPVPFTLTELLTLHLGRDLFGVLRGTVFHDSLESLMDKIISTLPPETLDFLERVKARYRMSGGPLKDYGRYRELVGQVNQAVMDNRTIEIAYHSLNGDAPSLRKVDPYRIWFYDSTIYIIGRCHLRNEIRTFVLDRISMLRVTGKGFTLPDDFVFEEYVRHSFKVMRDEMYTVRIRISPAWTRYVCERIWHPSQCLQKLIDGGVELSFRVAGLDEMCQWVMSLGPEACVLEPPELRAMLARRMKQALEQYDDEDLESLPDFDATVERQRAYHTGLRETR